MIPARTLATAGRVLRQLVHDPRTLALMLLLPCLLLTLLKFVFYQDTRVFNTIAPQLLGIFPLIIMFLVTSVTTLRERTSGTLDRLMTLPLSKLDILFGYAMAFLLLGLLQALLATSLLLVILDVPVAGGTLAIIACTLAASFLGTSLGLFVSAFATSEFQAVEFVMPTVIPQLLLCGLFVTRERMASGLQSLADILPLSYSVEAMKIVSTQAGWTGDLSKDLAVVTGFGVVALVLGSVTLRRKR